MVTGSSFILCIALFPYHGDSSGAILEVPSEALLHLSVISQSSLGVFREGIREVKEAAILRISTFGWLGVLRFILGSSLVINTEEFGKVQGNGILRIVLLYRRKVMRL